MYDSTVETARSNTFGITSTLSRSGKVLADRHAGHSVDFLLTTSRAASASTVPQMPGGIPQLPTPAAGIFSFNPNRFRGDSGLPVLKKPTAKAAMMRMAIRGNTEAHVADGRGFPDFSLKLNPSSDTPQLGAD